ncbi:MAG: hypothetical protein KDK64_00725 [Chlamydiia bacterium]|nr:hypothetical protein [Chlamydiia bacterium]
MQRVYALIFFFTTFLFPLAAEMEIETPSFIDSPHVPNREPRLMINNRPLAKVNGKVISLYDVVKKMDLFLYDYYPDYTPSTPERYQFYMARWQPTLDDMIADELILLDAEQKEIKISDGEVREELEERFGPNIMSNLDKVNLQYEEARDIIRNELRVQQLIGMKVHAKAFQVTTPQVIKAAYDDYLKKNPAEDEWTYRVLSIRGKDKELCESLAAKASALLEDPNHSLESVAESIDLDGISVSVSDEYQGSSSKISKLHFDVIQALSPEMYSTPVTQVSRFDNSNVVRIFHLKDLIHHLPNTFEEMHDKLKNELLFETSDKEKSAYIKTLKVRFGYDKDDPKYELPEDYHPFVII